MKYAYIVALTCALGCAMNSSAVESKKVKYICSLNIPGSDYSTTFETLEECRKYCDVCEETEAKTVVPTEFD